MAFDTYAGLQEAIGAWLCRDDLGARIPDFIRLAEARFNRVLMVPERELVATFTAAAESHELPVDFWGMRAIHADLSSKFPLRQMSLAELRLEYGFGRTGRPLHYAIQGGDTPQDFYVRKQARSEVQPALVGEQPNREIFETMGAQASPPPSEEIIRRLPARDPYETRVVGSRTEEVELALQLPVERYWIEQMRGQQYVRILELS